MFEDNALVVLIHLQDAEPLTSEVLAGEITFDVGFEQFARMETTDNHFAVR